MVAGKGQWFPCQRVNAFSVAPGRPGGCNSVCRGAGQQLRELVSDSGRAMQRRGLVAGPDFEYFQRRFFTPAEVAEHNQPEDLWVSYLGYVYDLTPLAQEYKGNLLLKPIVEVAGQDISHWFDPKTRDIRKHIDPLTGCLRYRTPRGRFVHVPPQLPRSDWANDFGTAWWQGSTYEVGRLSAKTRNIRIINTLTSQEHTLELHMEVRREEPEHELYPGREWDPG
ncbi:cytochrome b5 domain-containing protein 1 isoform X2 [Tupaia chinensis]|uniref:cytochrome b5 domain-containing protein 1 isoform X2 n=1 Tax=Tupaia chinensis TaxID=246437 RepID=UPI000FFB57CE|nr:cytochrome b5 domain-containing protein 1 isoform X2 [Tupaia chinensis]